MLKFNAFRTSKRISVVHSSLIIPTNPTLTPIVARRNVTTKATTHPRHASRPPSSEWRAVKGSSSATSTSTSKSVERTRETQFGDGMPSFMDLDSWPTELDPEALELDRQRKQEEQQRQQQSTINQSTSSSLSFHLPPTFTKDTGKEGEKEKAEPSSSSSLPSSLLPPEVVNPQIQEALRDLYSAVARNELGQVVKAYHRLRVHHGLEKFVDADVTKVSQMLTDYLSHAPVKSEERKEAEEMSIFFCTRGVMAPLNEAMAFHLRSNNPTRIFELWDMYDRWGKKPIYLAGKRNMSIDDRMLYVCAAAAITNEFTWIYHAMSTSSTVFPDWRVNDFVQRALTGYEPAVRQRFRDFLHDAMLTRDVDLFYPLASQVREAGEHGDYEAIEALCRNIRDGIERGLLVPGPALDPKVPKSTWSPRIVDERVWTLLVYGAIRSRKVDVAGMIVQEMKAVGVRPSIRIWNYILMGMVKTGAQPRMLQVLNKMREDGHEPDLMSQTIVLRALFDKREYTL
ncbi:hypothetical protein FRC19_005587 [Serendipita sp. 401]|nr:hypothetical protein FRC19_005587 [Serendipita sp. 401]